MSKYCLRYTNLFFSKDFLILIESISEKCNKNKITNRTFLNQFLNKIKAITEYLYNIWYR